MKGKRVIRYEGVFDPSQILSGIKQIQNQLNNANVSVDISKNYTTQLNKIEKKTSSIMSKINKGFSTESEINSFEKEMTELFSQFQSLILGFSSQKIDLKDIIFTEEVDARLKELNSTLDEYRNKLKSLSGLQSEQLGKITALSSSDTEKINKALNTKDPVARNQNIYNVKKELEDSASQGVLNDKELKDYNSKLEEVNKNLDEAKQKRDEFLKQNPKHKDEDLEYRIQQLQTLRELINQNSKNQGKGAKNPINKDLSIHSGYKGDFTYEMNGKEYTMTQERYKEWLGNLKEIENAIKINKELEKDITGLEKQKEETEETLKNHEEAAIKLKTIQGLFNVIAGKEEELDDDTRKILQEFINWNNGIKNVKDNLQKVEDDITDIQNKAKKAAEDEFSKMKDNTEKLKSAMGNTSAEAEELRNNFNKLNNEDKFFNDLQNRIGMVLDLGSAFNYAQRAIRFTFNTIKELDAAFTEIAVVTSQTNEQLWESFDTYNDMAQKLGITTQDAIKTSALYYQQGLETAEVMTLTEETIKMARIAGMDFADATDRMTAALRGFKLEMQDASRVNDVFSALAAESAVDTDELSYALTKTASIAASAGMELETTSAFLSQMINFATYTRVA